MNLLRKYTEYYIRTQKFLNALRYDVLPSLVAPRNRAAIGYAFNSETTLMSVDMAWNQFVQGNGVNGEAFDYDTKRSDDNTLKSEFFKTYPLDECWTKEEITIHTVGKADQFEIENSVIECHTSHCINSTGEDYEPNLEIPEHRNLYDLVDDVMIERCRITNTKYTLHPSHLLLT